MAIADIPTARPERSKTVLNPSRNPMAEKLVEPWKFPHPARSQMRCIARSSPISRGTRLADLSPEAET
jgi:hypothetical protein